jgi:hypothetical protein
MNYTKSFRYDDEARPEVHKWIQKQKKRGEGAFTIALLDLIEAAEKTPPAPLVTRDEFEELIKEINIIKSMGYRPISEIKEKLELPETDFQQEAAGEIKTAEPDTNKIRSRYFKK